MNYKSLHKLYILAAVIYMLNSLCYSYGYYLTPSPVYLGAATGWLAALILIAIIDDSTHREECQLSLIDDLEKTIKGLKAENKEYKEAIEKAIKDLDYILS